MNEVVLQRQIAEGLRARGAEVIVTHDAKHKPVTRGVTDIMAVFPGQILFIECKGPEGKVSEEQASFMARMMAKGHTCIVAKSWDDVERYL